MSTARGVVGRGVELATAYEALRAAAEGRSSSLLIEGDAGIGKTRMVGAIVEAARARGMSVLSGQAHPFERTRPFGVVASALGLERRSADPRRAAVGR